MSLDEAIRGLYWESDPTRITRVAALALGIDRVAECREPLRRVLDAGRAGRAVATAPTAFALLCAGDVATGRWAEATELAEEGIALCERRGHRPAAARLHLGSALIAAARGDEVRTRALTDRVAGCGVVEERHRVLALSALGRGHAEDAYRHAVSAGPRVSLDLVEAALQLGLREEATRHVRAMRDAPLHTVSARFAMLTAASAALVAAPGAAEALFDEALAAADADRWPFDQARIRLAYGEHLRRLRRADRSRVLLGAALDTFLCLEAHPWAARARHGLRATGVTIGRPAEAAALTPDELAVAALAAAGLTNRQIALQLTVSHHTVAARLYQAFPKLGVGSRAALHDAMQTLGGIA